MATRIVIAVDGPLQMKLVEYFMEDFTEVGGFNHGNRQSRAGWEEKRKNWATIEAIDANLREDKPGTLGFVEGVLQDLCVGRPGVDFHAAFNSKQNPNAYTNAREEIVAFCKGDHPNVTWSTISPELHSLSRIFGGRLTECGAAPTILPRVPKEQKAAADKAAGGNVAQAKRAPAAKATVTTGQDEMGTYTLTTLASGATTKRYTNINTANLVGEAPAIGLEEASNDDVAPVEDAAVMEQASNDDVAIPSVDALFGE